MFGLGQGQAMAQDERIARLIASETRDAEWIRYLPAARKLLSQYDLLPRVREAGGLLG